MAYKCKLCGKGPAGGKAVSHSHRVTPRTFNPNLFRKRIVLNGAPQRVYVCSICIKSGKASTV